MSKRNWKRVLLAFHFAREGGREIGWGIADYVRRHNVAWELATEELAPLNDLVDGFGPFDGAVVETYNVGLRERVAALGCPVVGALGSQSPPDFPYVSDDQRAIGRAAFEHLRSCGFRKLGCCGQGEIDWSEQRLNSFIKAAEQATDDGAVEIIRLPTVEPARPADRSSQRRTIGEALASAPRPIGVFGVSTRVCWLVAEACHEQGLRIPEDVALLAAGYDDLNCELANPPLSVVDAGNQTIGYETAAILDRLMQGQTAETKRVPVFPTGVIQRRSTDVLAVDDPLVLRALRFIREQVGEMIGVDEVVDAVGVSRRLLERRFRDAMDRTIYQEITRVRIDQACRMLSLTSMSVIEVAVRCGFAYKQQFNAAFRRTMGMTPLEYRERTLPGAMDGRRAQNR